MKIGILGSGLIVPEFLRGAKEVSSIEVSAICGRKQSEEKVRALAKANDIQGVFFDRADFFASDIDAVYIALPNHLHFSSAAEAIKAGKHVIVEKPFASNLSEASELFSLAEERGVFVFEAAASVYLPAVKKAKKWISEIGRIRIVQSNYSQYSRRYEFFKSGETPAVFDPKQSGGALMDLGVYNAHFVCLLFGSPSSVLYEANTERGIDTSGTLILRYPDFYCVLTAAKDSASPCSISVQGDGGSIFSPCSANTITRAELLKRGENPVIFECNEGDRMSFELAEFARIIQNADDEAYRKAKELTLSVMRILDLGRTQAGIL